MSAQTVIVNEVNVKGYILSVTSRDTEDTTPAMLEELTFRTVGAWLAIADALENGTADKFAGFGSVEERYADELNKAVVDTDAPKLPVFQFSETFGDARCTCWDTFRGTKSIHFHLNSDDKIPVAIATWQANQNAIKRIFETYHLKPIPDAPQAPPAGATSDMKPSTPKSQNAPQNAPNGNIAPIEGVIVASTWPDKKKVQFADGQLASYTITKIKAAFYKGSPTFELYTSFGGNYPGFTVYKFKSGTQELTPTYEAIVGVLGSLNLTLEQPEKVGTWRAVIKANHSEKNGEIVEYKNVQSLAAI